MLCYEISLNNERKCLAGLTADGVISIMVGSATRAGELRGPPHLIVGGLDATTKEHLRWAEASLTAGDTVVLRLLESDTADPPFKRDKIDEGNGGT